MNTGGNEVEIKFRVVEPKALEAKLEQAGFRLLTPRTHEMNILYDRSSRALRKRGEVLRLRKYGDAWTLTHKSKPVDGRHKTRREFETQVADGDQVAAILSALGFFPVFRYEKFRTEWTDDQGHVVLDETPIGVLAEIEGAPDWIDRTAARLGVAATDYLTASYVALFFAWKKQTGSPAEEMTFSAVGS